MKNKYRFKFSKEGRIKFIGHLDLMRIFSKASKRAGLKTAYSQGFNPHQLIGVAVPLSLGMESCCEIVEIGFAEAGDVPEVVEKLNNALPRGIKIISGRILEDGEKNAASLVHAARYEITLDGFPDLKDSVAEIMAAEKILVMKKTKSGEKETDLRPDIFELGEISPEDGRRKLFAVLAAGGKANLKPELLVREIYTLLGMREAFDPYKADYLRTNLFECRNGELFEIV